MFALLLRLGRWCDAAGRAFAYLAAGTLTRSDLLEMQRREWSRYCIAPEEVLTGLFQWEKQLFAAHLRPGERVLVIGSGSGRDVLALHREGFDVVAVESAPGAIAVARDIFQSQGVGIPIIEGGFEDAPLPGRFNAIVLSSYMISYIPERARRVAAFQRLLPHLAPGGRVLLSYIKLNWPLTTRSITLTRWMARLTGSDWSPEHHDVLQHRDSWAREILFEHWFLPAEIEAEVRAAGLAVIDHREYMVTPALVAVPQAEAPVPPTESGR